MGSPRGEATPLVSVLHKMVCLATLGSRVQEWPFMVLPTLDHFPLRSTNEITSLSQNQQMLLICFAYFATLC
jgi:hypothetical protein